MTGVNMGDPAAWAAGPDVPWTSGWFTRGDNTSADGGDSVDPNTPKLSFDMIGIPGDLLQTGNAFKFSGAVAVGKKVYFVPHNENVTLVLDTSSVPEVLDKYSPDTTNNFSTIHMNTSEPATGYAHYNGAVAVGTMIYLVPAAQRDVGVITTTTDSFTTIATNLDAGHGEDSGWKAYSGGAVVAGKVVVFAPSGENNTGVLDTTTNMFITVATAGDAAFGHSKYRGAASVGTKAYFAPCRQNNTGVLDTATNVFSTVALTGQEAVSEECKYSGAVAVGNKVYFTPYVQNNVGVLDASTDTFSTIAISGLYPETGSHLYSGAAANGTTIYFAPHNQMNVGVLDTTTGIFSTIPTTGSAGLLEVHGYHASWKYDGAAAVGDKVFFAPFEMNNVGYIRVVSPAEEALEEANRPVMGSIEWCGFADDSDGSTKPSFSMIEFPSGSEEYSSSGAVAIGSRLFFVPFWENVILVLDTDTNSFTNISMNMSEKHTFIGAAAVDSDIVFFNDQSQTPIWVLNTTTSSFSSIAPPSDGIFVGYSGATVIGSKMVFAPAQGNITHVLDTTTYTLTTLPLTGNAASGYEKYRGAASVGTTAYFAPYEQNNVGVLDTATNTFSTIPTTGDAAAGERKYAGAVAVGSKVYFTPFEQNNVGVLDTITNVFSTINVTGICPRYDNNKYAGAGAAIGTTVYFAPSAQFTVGVLDTTTNYFSTIHATGASELPFSYQAYDGAVAVDNTVYFAPREMHNVGYVQVE
jgi:hypothetical protein